MKDYLITEKAGPYVAGVRNTGVGTPLRLTIKQAEAGLREGHLIEVPGPDEAKQEPKTADPKVAEPKAADTKAPDPKQK